MCKYSTLIVRILTVKILLYRLSFSVMNTVFVLEHPRKYAVIFADRNYKTLYTFQQLKL